MGLRAGITAEVSFEGQVRLRHRLDRGLQLLLPGRRETVHVPGGAGRWRVPGGGDRLVRLQRPQRPVQGGQVIVDPERFQTDHEVVPVARLFLQQQQQTGTKEALRKRPKPSRRSPFPR